MNPVDTVIEYFSEVSGVPVERVYYNEKTCNNIQQALNQYQLSEIKNALHFASNHKDMDSPERFNLPYLFTPGKIDRWVWSAKKKETRGGFRWSVPDKMKRPEWMSDRQKVS